MNLMASPTVQQRLLAAELRKLRKRADVSLEAASERLSLTPSSLSRIETGHGGVKPVYVELLSELYGLEPDERAELIQRAKDAKKNKGWWQEFSGMLTEAYRDYIGLEDEARTIRNFEPLFVPGLLQTPEYARAVIPAVWTDADEEEIDKAVTIRVARQKRLTDKPALQFWAIVDEGALRRPTGGTKVMREQLIHLSQQAELPNVTIQVLPTSVGAHAGMAGAFSIIEFPDLEDLDAVYVDSVAGELFLNKPADIRRCNELYRNLIAASLNPVSSLDVLHRMTRELA